jgi:DNA-binding transcriptional regulator YiaG
MTPAAYNATRQRLSLTHEALAQLLGVEPQTSRRWAMPSSNGPDERTVSHLKLIEALGVDEARRILETRK